MRRRLPRAIALSVLSLALAACAGSGQATRAEAPDETVVEAASVAPQAVVEPDAGDIPATDATVVFTEPTQAELDYAAIYGGQGYNPVADPTLPAPAELPASYDPWEPFNRRVHRFNDVVDRYVASPLAHAYVDVVP